MIHLRHLFVRGVRFDTEVQYRVTGGRGGRAAGVNPERSRYCPLPLKAPLDLEPADGGVLSAIQCAAILGQTAIGQLPALAHQVHCTGQEVLRLVQTCVPDAQGEVLETPERGMLDFCVLHGMHHGGITLLQWTSGAQTRWSLIMGAELNAQASPDAGVLRALLLLDSHGSEPWACGHNARIELASPKADGGLLCRHLTGEVATVQLRYLVRVLPAPTVEKAVVTAA